ncbi:MAG: YqgE/AlgH family protein [Chitinophagaceae bacterium]
MQITPGTLLKSVASSQPDYFDGAIVLVVERNADGTIGVVVNRQYGRQLTDLEAFKQAQKIGLYEGGPMQQDHLYFIHRIADDIVGSASVNTAIHFGGNIKQALSLIRQGKSALKDIKIFVGYCGWDNGQLESEVGDGAWDIVEMSDDVVFFDFRFG